MVKDLPSDDVLRKLSRPRLQKLAKVLMRYMINSVQLVLISNAGTQTESQLVIRRIDQGTPRQCIE